MSIRHDLFKNAMANFLLGVVVFVLKVVVIVQGKVHVDRMAFWILGDEIGKRLLFRVVVKVFLSESIEVGCQIIVLLQ